jgi:glycosyltransferase involved in cell wall biosynthesis
LQSIYKYGNNNEGTGKMKILFLALDVNVKSTTGDAVHVRELARSFAALGHEVSMVVPQTQGSDDELAPLKEHGNLKIFFLPPRSRFRNLSTVLSCRRIAKDQGCEVIYERRFTPKIGYALTKLLRIPLLVEINGLRDKEKQLQEGKSASSGGKQGFKRRMWRHFFRSVKQVVVVSEGLKKGLSEEYGIERNKITVIYNGANIDMFKPMDREKCLRELGLDENFRYIGFIGNFAPWQGVDQLISAAPRILKAQPNVKFVIVGDGLLGKELRSSAADLGISDKVLFPGFVPYKMVPTYINAFDICAAPFGGIERNVKYSFSAIKLYEYMACGKPVVTTDVIGIKNEMQKLGLGRIVNADDKEGLSNAIIELLADRDMQITLGQKAREWVEAEHSWKNVAARIVDLCQVHVTGTTTI